MSTNSLTRERVTQSIATLANANTIITQVIKEVAGNDISSTINESRLTTELISSMAQSRYISELQKTA